ncbi:MAG: MlaD family protein [Fibromonadaceae bacterium]|jgi:ABC-type transporter Mla subunit MlaD|nr:MlaD family protein [Oscillospiraceae bacterium]MDR2732938.1 MlaD family protein [Fibromonadaceae bacterium]
MNRDRLIGNITVAIVLLLLVYVAVAMWQNERRAHNSILVQFPEMGALQNEDIVTIRGLAIGRIARITRANEKALVEIDLDESRIFRKDTRFRNVSPDIMGSRRIAIEPGKKGEPAPKGYVFEGEFEPGFAEVLALSDVAKEQVANIMEFIRLLHTGDENNASLQSKVEEILIDCEDLVFALDKTLKTVERETMGALNKVGKYAADISDATIKIGETLDTLRVQAKDGIVSAENIISQVQSTIESLDKILTEFENSPVTIALLDEKGIINDLDSMRSALQAFIGSIDGKGIIIYDEKGKRKSMVSLKNIHPFRETARSKAKKRAAQENRN